MKRTMLLAGLSVALGCGGDTTPPKSTGTPPTPSVQTREARKTEVKTTTPADVPEPPPPNAVKDKGKTDKKDGDEPKSPPPVKKD